MNARSKTRYHASSNWTRMSQASIDARQAIVQWKPQLPKPLSTIQGYGLAILPVSVSLAAALFLGRYNFRGVADSLFLVALAIVVWYAGPGPAILAVVLSGLANTYFFIEPLYSIYITPADVPHFVIF